MVAIVRDLITASLIESSVLAAEGTFIRRDAPEALPALTDIDLMVVDWTDRAPGWGAMISAWRDGASPPPRVVLFGPHTDLAAHADAREAGLRPMRARSAFFAALPRLIAQASAERPIR